jgi:hypothetical protein
LRRDLDLGQLRRVRTWRSTGDQATAARIVLGWPCAVGIRFARRRAQPVIGREAATTCMKSWHDRVCETG